MDRASRYLVSFFSLFVLFTGNCFSESLEWQTEVDGLEQKASGDINVESAQEIAAEVQRLFEKSKGYDRDYRLSDLQTKRLQDVLWAIQDQMKSGPTKKWVEETLKTAGPPIKKVNESLQRAKMKTATFEDAKVIKLSLERDRYLKSFNFADERKARVIALEPFSSPQILEQLGEELLAGPAQEEASEVINKIADSMRNESLAKFLSNILLKSLSKLKSYEDKPRSWDLKKMEEALHTLLLKVSEPNAAEIREYLKSSGPSLKELNDTLVRVESGNARQRDLDIFESALQKDKYLLSSDHHNQRERIWQAVSKSGQRGAVNILIDEVMKSSSAIPALSAAAQRVTDRTEAALTADHLHKSLARLRRYDRDARPEEAQMLTLNQALEHLSKVGGVSFKEAPVSGGGSSPRRANTMTRRDLLSFPCKILEVLGLTR
jgi:hypothetical protein